MSKKNPFVPRDGIKVGKKSIAVMPHGPTIDRNSNPLEGEFRGNQDTNAMEMYLNGNWVSIGSTGLGIGLPFTGNGVIKDAGYYEINTTLGPITLTLPVDPNIGTIFYLQDLKGTWSKNPVTLERSGRLINGVSSNKTFAVNYSNIQLTYMGDDYGWRSSGTVLDAPGLINSDNKTVDFNAENKYRYPIDTTVASRIVTLPAAPVSGDQIVLFDVKGTWQTNSVTIVPNGKRIGSSLSNVIIKQSDAVVTLEYIDNTFGWLIQVFAKPRSNASLTTAPKLVGSAILQPNFFYEANTNAGSYQVSVPTPVSVVNGDTIIIVDTDFTWGKNPLTLDTNTGKINGSVTDIVVSTPGIQITLRYENATIGWIMTTESLIPHDHYNPRIIGNISGTSTLLEAGVYIFNHTATIDITLPTTLKDHTKVVLLDPLQKLGANSVTVMGGGAKINNALTPIELSKSGGKIEFIYIAGNWMMSVIDSVEQLPLPKMELDPVPKTADFSPSLLYTYVINTAANKVKATLPASPVAGDRISFFDSGRTWNENGLEIVGVGQKFEGEALPKLFKLNGQNVDLLYVNSTIGWKDINSDGYDSYKIQEIPADGRVLENNVMYLVSSDNVNKSLKLPATPSAGQKVFIVDVNNSFRAVKFTLNGNGNEIDNNAFPITFKDTGSFLELLYINNTYGWRSSVNYGTTPTRLIELSPTGLTTGQSLRSSTAYQLLALVPNMVVNLPTNAVAGETIEITDVNGVLGTPGTSGYLRVNGTVDGEASSFSLLSQTKGKFGFEYINPTVGWRSSVTTGTTEVATGSVTTSDSLVCHPGKLYRVTHNSSGTIVLEANVPIGSQVKIEIAEKNYVGGIVVTTTGIRKFNNLTSTYSIGDIEGVYTFTRGTGMWIVERSERNVETIVVTANTTLIPGCTYDVRTKNIVLTLPNYSDTKLNETEVRIGTELTFTSSDKFTVTDGTNTWEFNRGKDYIVFSSNVKSGQWHLVSHMPEAVLDLSRKVGVYTADATVPITSDTTALLTMSATNAPVELGVGSPGETIRLYLVSKPETKFNYLFIPAAGQKIDSGNSYTTEGNITYIEFEYIDAVIGWKVRPTYAESSFSYAATKNNDFTGVNNKYYTVDCSGGPVTVTMPANGNPGDRFGIKDHGWTFASNPCTITGTINGSPSTYTSNTVGNYIEYIYIDDVTKWSPVLNNEVIEYVPLTGTLNANNAEFAGYDNGGVSIFNVVGDTTVKSVLMPTTITPKIGTEIYLHDHQGTWASKPWRLASTGQRLNGELHSIDVDTEFGHVYMIYTGTQFGWLVDVHQRPTQDFQLFTANGNVDVNHGKTIIARANTSASALTLTVVGSVVKGQRILVIDEAGTFGRNPLTLNLNGKKYRGNAVNPVYRKHSYVGELIYVDDTYGWKELFNTFEPMEKVITNPAGEVIDMLPRCSYSFEPSAALTGIYQLNLPTTPTIGDEYIIRTENSNVFNGSNTTVSSPSFPINGSNTPFKPERADIVYKFLFTGSDWTYEEIKGTYLKGATSTPWTRLIEAPAVITSAIAVKPLEQMHVVAFDQVAPELVIDLTGRPTRSIRIAFHDKTNTISKTKPLVIKSTGTSGMFNSAGQYEFTAPGSFVEFEYLPSADKWALVHQLPIPTFDKIEQGNEILGNTTVSPNTRYKLNKPLTTYNVTLPDSAPIGSKIEFYSTESLYSLGKYVGFISGLAIGGVTEGAQPSLKLNSGITSFTLVRGAGEWGVESLVSQTTKLQLPLNVSLADNVLPMNSICSLRNLGSREAVLPPVPCPIGTTVSVRIDPVENTEVEFLIHTTVAKTKTFSLHDKSKVYNFTYCVDGWNLEVSDVEGGLLKRSLISANTTIQCGTYNPVTTATGVVTLTLPSITKVHGTTRVVIQDSAGNAATNKIVISAPDGDIQGASTVEITQAFAWIELTHFSDTGKWSITGRYPPTDIILPQMVHSFKDTDFMLEGLNAYTITDDGVTEIDMSSGWPGDKAVVYFKPMSGFPIKFINGTVNGGELTYLTEQNATYLFEYVEDLGWLCTVMSPNSHLYFLNENNGALSGTNTLIAVKPNHIHLVRNGALGSRVIYTADPVDFVDGQKATFAVSDDGQGHAIIKLAAGHMLDRSTNYVTLQPGDKLTIQWHVKYNQFLTTERSFHNLEKGAGMMPLNSASPVIPTLGLINLPNSSLNGVSPFVMDATWSVGTVVTIGDPFSVLDYTTKVITVAPGAARTINGGATSFTITDPNSIYKFTLVGTDWKPSTIGKERIPQVSVTSTSVAQINKDHNIGALISPIVLTLPLMNGMETNHFVNVIDVGGTVKDKSVTINCPAGAKFHDSTTTKEFKTNYGIMTFRHRPSDNVWVIETNGAGGNSSTGGSGSVNELPVLALNSNQIAIPNRHYIKDVAASCTLTLPPTPPVGTLLRIGMYGNTAPNELSIALNGDPVRLLKSTQAEFTLRQVYRDVLMVFSSDGVWDILRNEGQETMGHQVQLLTNANGLIPGRSHSLITGVVASNIVSSDRALDGDVIYASTTKLTETKLVFTEGKYTLYGNLVNSPDYLVKGESGGIKLVYNGKKELWGIEIDTINHNTTAPVLINDTISLPGSNVDVSTELVDSKVAVYTNGNLVKTSLRRKMNWPYNAKLAGYGRSLDNYDKISFSTTTFTGPNTSSGSKKIVPKGKVVNLSGLPTATKVSVQDYEYTHPEIGDASFLDKDYSGASENEFFIIDPTMLTGSIVEPISGFTPNHCVIFTDPYGNLENKSVVFKPIDGMLVDGQPTKVMDTNSGYWKILFTGKEWVTIAQHSMVTPIVYNTAESVLAGSSLTAAPIVNINRLTIVEMANGGFIKLPEIPQDGSYVDITVSNDPRDWIKTIPLTISAQGTDTIQNVSSVYLFANNSAKLCFVYEVGNWRLTSEGVESVNDYRAVDPVVTNTVAEVCAKNLVNNEDDVTITLPSFTVAPSHALEIYVMRTGNGVDGDGDTTIVIPAAAGDLRGNSVVKLTHPNSIALFRLDPFQLIWHMVFVSPKPDTGGVGVIYKTDSTGSSKTLEVSTLYSVVANSSAVTLTLPNGVKNGDVIEVFNENVSSPLIRPLEVTTAGSFNTGSSTYKFSAKLEHVRFIWRTAQNNWLVVRMDVGNLVKGISNYAASGPSLTATEEVRYPGTYTIATAAVFPEKYTAITWIVDSTPISDGSMLTFRTAPDKCYANIVGKSSNTFAPDQTFTLFPGESINFVKIDGLLYPHATVRSVAREENLEVATASAMSSFNNHILMGLVNKPCPIGAAFLISADNRIYPQGSWFDVGDLDGVMVDITKAISVTAPAGYTVNGVASTQIPDRRHIFRFTLNGTNWNMVRHRVIADSKSISEDVAGFSGTKMLNLSYGSPVQRIKLVGDYAPTSALGAQGFDHEGIVEVIQDATGGRNMTLENVPTAVLNPNSSIKIGKAPNEVTLLRFYSRDGVLTLTNYIAVAAATNAATPPTEVVAHTGPYTINAVANKYTFIEMTGTLGFLDVTVSDPNIVAEFMVTVKVNTSTPNISFPNAGAKWFSLSNNMLTGVVNGDIVTVQGYKFKGNVYYSAAVMQTV